MVAPALFSSAKEDWATPQPLFDRIAEEFHFGLDAAASDSNRKVEPWLKDGALEANWGELSGGGDVWLNPPYGREIGKWVGKAAQTARDGVIVVCLLPARTDTRWWHAHVWDERYDRPRDGVEIRFLKGRVRFVGAKAGAPFPSVVVIFRPPRGGR
jgi:phage N-6-adenine-methyltransferase